MAFNGGKEIMERAEIYHYLITGLDVIILIILWLSFRKHYLGRKYDINYHSRWLLVCTCLIMANTFAIATAMYSYWIYRDPSHEIINFGRAADRYCMLFAYFSFSKIEDR